MRIETAAGVQINTGHKAPLTSALKATLNRLSGEDLYIVPPVETRWVETLTDPKKPSIWAGKGPSFDSDDNGRVFCRILDNGYMTHYKNDSRRTDTSQYDEDQVFEGSCEREPIRMSYYQRSEREDRNCTGRNIGIGKRNVPTKIYQWSLNEMITVLRCAKTIKKGCSHDSHGSHGRKPRYKDSLNHRPKG